MEIVGVHRLQTYRSEEPPETTTEPKDSLLHDYRQGYPFFVRRGARSVDSFMIRYAKELDIKCLKKLGLC